MKKQIDKKVSIDFSIKVKHNTFTGKLKNVQSEVETMGNNKQIHTTKPNKRLCDIRHFYGQTQKEAAKLFRVSPSYYIKIEGGFCKAGRGFIERFHELYPEEDVNIFFR